MLNEAMAAIHKQRDDLMRQQQSLNEITATVRSKRRQISATVDARGELVDLKFHGQTHKNMSPEELGALIVETVRQARHDAQTQMWESVADTLPEGAEVADVVSGRYDWSDAIGEALTLPKPLLDLLGNPPAGLPEAADYASFVEAMTNGAHADGAASNGAVSNGAHANGAASNGAAPNGARTGQGPAADPPAAGGTADGKSPR
jgi:DNA-binding protein YbaB